ncbi:hypothetical protein [Microbacterium indicum]|uniref:hypothetical protein n=1 Tax=Microbacterium indicum TaxID=358100 RepID=UPI001B7F97FC|nr:hypothetical protein [Microbacterium indicum]
MARETLAVTAYATGDFALALRELRTVRRITGRNENVAMIVDSERGVGRPEKALEEGRSADRESLGVEQRVELAIAMSGARLDLGETELALHELDIPELDPDHAYEWSAGLFAARAAVLEDLGREDEAAEWARRAEIAEDAIESVRAQGDTIEIEEIEYEFSDEDSEADEPVAETDEQFDAEDLADEAEPEDAGDEPEAVVDEPVAEEPKPEEPAVEAAPADDDDESEPSIENEVSEILAEAGITDGEDEPEAAEADLAHSADGAGGGEADDEKSDETPSSEAKPDEKGDGEARPDGALF